MSHISFRISNTSFVAKAKYAFATMSVFLCIACSSDGVIEEIKEIDTNGTDLMRFTRAIEAQTTPSTRAEVNYLKSGFMVSTYKAFGNTSAQQTVMSKYKVEHRTTGSGWDGNTQDNWEYIGVNGQKEKYWDYSNFPYRFNAIAPCPTETDVILSDNELKITKSYSYQTCTDGALSPADAAAEPYLVAQVQRTAEGKDYDIFVGGTDNEINKSSQTLNRYVALPFHHLNSKIRFGVYTKNLWATENDTYIQDLKINVSSESFVTKATGYAITNEESWYDKTSDNSKFTSVTKLTSTDTKPTLLTFTGVTGGSAVEGNNMKLHQSQSTAYMLKCPDGIMQLPQKDVKMTVSLKLMQPGSSTPVKEYTNVPIKLEDYTEVFTWQSGFIYTYYLILDFDSNLEIQFTCTLTPWEDISGSLSTDLEQ